MRLTLRTMLAYLDEILEPEDHEEIRRKIEESEFASDLVRRIQDVTRRLRLGAPPPLGLGVGPDPNTVSEYLDNALSAERVPDFERVCLDADLCLAEVAACHQILTLVLGQPAEVAPVSRQRMYSLIEEQLVSQRPGGNGRPDQLSPSEGVDKLMDLGEIPAESVASAVADTGRPQTADPTQPVVNRTRRRRPEIPDYLRSSGGHRIRRFMAAALLLVVGGSALYWAVSSGHLARMLTSRPATMPGPLVDDSAGNKESASPETAGASADAGSDRPPDALSADQNETAASGGEEVLAMDPEDPRGRDGAEPGVPEPDATVSMEAADGASRKANVSEEQPTGQAAVGDEAPVAGGADSAGDSDPSLRNPTETVAGGSPSASELLRSLDPAVGGGVDSQAAATQASADDALAVSGGIPPLPDQALADATGAAAPEAQDSLSDAEAESAGVDQRPDAAGESEDGAESVDRGKLGFYSNQAVLLRLDSVTGQWQRVAPRAAVFVGQRLLALPLYRPTVSLAAGIHVEIVGGTSLTFAENDAGSWPAIQVEYGRVILMNVGQPKNRVDLVLESGRLPLVFEASGATLAVELRREHEAGADPELAAAPLLVRFFVTSGIVRAELEVGPTLLEAPAGWEFAVGELKALPSESEPPEWTRAEKLTPLDQRAMAALAGELVLDRPAGVVLKELVDSQGAGRRSEVRSLAARSAVHVGQFELFVSALNDREQKVGTWPPLLIETLREALSLSPETAARIHEAFRSQRGPAEGDELFRLLRGYTPEDLEQGADEQLVNYLEHDKLDIRLLAHWNLMRITGLGQPGRLQDPKADRQQAIRVWRKRLTDGQIVPRAATVP
jgi:hypothetical protein